MKTPQELLDDLQFTHSMWLNELSHAEVELDIFSHRLNIYGANLQSVSEPESIGLIMVDIEQLRLAITFIKKDILNHVKRLNKKTKLNGELHAILDGEHEENQERIAQVRKHLYVVRSKFFNIIPVEV